MPQGLFVQAKVFLPQQNPRFPGGAQNAARDRRFNITWTATDKSPSGTPNGVQGPWVRASRFVLEVQYAIAQPPPSSPTDTDLVLGATELASRRAHNDALAIEWAFVQPGVWDGAGTAIAYNRLEAITAAKVDKVRAVCRIAGEILFHQSAAARPDLWVP